jgi:hypothetical protein
MQVKEEPIEIISDDEANIEQMNNEDEAWTGNELQANAGVVNNVQETDGVDYHHFGFHWKTPSLGMQKSIFNKSSIIFYYEINISICFE